MVTKIGKFQQNIGYNSACKWKVRRRSAGCMCNSWLAFVLTKDSLTLSCDCTRLNQGLWIANLTHVRRTALQNTTTPEGKALWFQAARIPDLPKRSIITMWQRCVFQASILIHAVTNDCRFKIFLNGKRTGFLDGKRTGLDLVKGLNHCHAGDTSDRQNATSLDSVTSEDKL